MKPRLPDGLVACVKRECPTCARVARILIALREAGERVTVFAQDDPAFPEGLAPVDDTSLEASWHHQIETVPTLLWVEDGAEAARTVGWSRERWEALTGAAGLGPALPGLRPGCGSPSVAPGRGDELAGRVGAGKLRGPPGGLPSPRAH